MHALVVPLLCGLLAGACTTDRPRDLAASAPPEDRPWYDQNVSPLVPPPPASPVDLAAADVAPGKVAAAPSTSPPGDAPSPTAPAAGPSTDPAPRAPGTDDDPFAGIFPTATVRDRVPETAAAQAAAPVASAQASTPRDEPPAGAAAAPATAAPAAAPSPVVQPPVASSAAISSRAEASDSGPPASASPPDASSPIAAATDRSGTEVTSLPGDTLFDAGRATLLPAGRAALDTLADSLRDTPYRSVKVVAHADRSGAPLANARLSWQRARAVRDHLAARGIAPDRLDFEGVGSAEARIDPSTCRGDRRARVRCLAPDRRVDVVVVRRAAS